MRKRIKNNYILGACVIIIMLLCILSVSQPIRFQKAMASREAEVKEKLMQIRQAEREIQGETRRIYRRFSDTGKEQAHKARCLNTFPYADGKKFTLAATVIVGSGKQIPVMEVAARL